MRSPAVFRTGLVTLALAGHLAMVGPVRSEDEAASTTAEAAAGFSAEQIEQMVAPVALDPDDARDPVEPSGVVDPADEGGAES